MKSTMTTLSKDAIIAMAREAGMVVVDDQFSLLSFLVRFADTCRADLVAENKKLSLHIGNDALRSENHELRAELSALRAGLVGAGCTHSGGREMIKIQFKDPDAIYEIIAAVHPFTDDEDRTTEDAASEFSRKYFQFGDYG